MQFSQAYDKVWFARFSEWVAVIGVSQLLMDKKLNDNNRLNLYGINCADFH